MRYALGYMSRVLGSAGIWIGGAFTWLVIGLVWFVASMWHCARRREIANALLWAIVIPFAAVIGCLALPAFYLVGEIVGWFQDRC